MATQDYQIKVITKARQAGVMKNPDGSLTVKVHAAPEQGKANQALIRLLAEHFAVTQSSIEIVKGLTKKIKLVRIHKP